MGYSPWGSKELDTTEESLLACTRGLGLSWLSFQGALFF